MVDHKITKDTRHKDGWVKGTHGDHTYQAKVYDEPSGYGINGGRVSKLHVQRGDQTKFEYDRDIGKKPSRLAHNIVQHLEKLPKEHDHPHWGDGKGNRNGDTK